MIKRLLKSKLLQMSTFYRTIILNPICVYPCSSVVKSINIILLMLNFNIYPLEESNIWDKVSWPMEKKMPISGSFAEFRNSHLHMGNDFKTYWINGFPIVAVFDGYVQSFSYSEIGYGLTFNLYSPKLDLIARYAHLNDLGGDLKGFDELKEALLLMGDEKGFNLKLKPDMFNVSSKQKIGRTGETGTGVSHLHLELFNGRGYYNPLFFKDYIQKDITPPTIQNLYIEMESDSHKYSVKNVSAGIYELETGEPIQTNGKLKFKIACFDQMTSRNKNGVYGLKLKVEEEIIYEKILDKMSYADAADRQNLYDINKSSLSPPHYVYNLFNEKNKNQPYSIDLSNYPSETIITIQAEILDSSNNVSNLKIPIQITKPTDLKNLDKSVNKVFESEDKKLSIDISKNIVTGIGKIQIDKIEELPKEIQIENFTLSGTPYLVKAMDLTWKGEAICSLQVELKGKEDSLYIYDTTIKSWMPIAFSKNKDKIQFKLMRLGIIAIMKDLIPPKVSYPFLMYREVNLPEIQDKSMIERFYTVSDVGSGIKRMELNLEGSPYPFIFDKDRNYIKVEIPKSFANIKTFLLIQIRLTDGSGNKSEWFSDIVNF